MSDFHSNDGEPSPEGCSSPAGDYRVGYGKPPVQHQFKPGQSGNPKGRQKTFARLDVSIGGALNEQVRITKGTGQKQISKHEMSLRALIQKALKGEWKAYMSLAKLHAKTGQIKKIEVPDVRGGVVRMPWEFWTKKFNSQNERWAEIHKEIDRRDALLVRGLPYDR